MTMARQVIGAIVLLIAGFLLFFEIWALADPAGTQMANDADPFGTPPGWEVHAAWLGIIAAMLAGGCWLIFGGRPGRNTPTHRRHRA